LGECLFTARLRAHPDNPRLFVRTEVVEQIAAQIARLGGFDPAHALLVRPFADAYQVIAGHHRKLAAEKAGLAAVPCWVREMSDEEAFMALVLANSQSELLPLERGLHALTAKGRANGGRGQKGGLSAYAETVGRTQQLITWEVAAAEVWKTHNHGCEFPSEKIPAARVLAELRVAASWLWPALVAALIAEGWNVDTARAQAAGLGRRAGHRGQAGA
jgi:ParB-like chromosome segregation protein Spo0J